MSYVNLIKKLFNVNLFGGMKLGLQNSSRLQELLQFPDRHYPSIHVAGTNGKGSVTTKIAYGLQAAGYKVGLYTSPHISCFRERIRINGEMIPESAVERILTHLFKIVERENIPATFFELTTFLALIYFAEQKVDVTVLETGLGGRLDATNSIKPILCVITSISLDHTEILGNSLEEIAKEKAGIIKPSIPIVIGPNVPYTIIKETADINRSPIIQVKEMGSTFEEENCLIASAALNKLKEHFRISDESINKGLEGKQPCRFERVKGKCPIILDVAHNPDGLIHLFEAVKKHYGLMSIRILFGLSKNKDIQGCLQIIREYGSAFHLVEAPNGRGVATAELKKGLENLKVTSESIIEHDSIEKGVKEAIVESELHEQILIICGSFFIMSQARHALGIKEDRDEFDMNERSTYILNNRS